MAAKGLVITPQGLPFNAAHWFSQHFIHLECRIDVPGGPVDAPWAISGFVIEVAGEVFLVTAGHCLAKVEEYRERGCTVKGWHLDDAAWISDRHTGLGVTAFETARYNGICPFLYDEAVKGHIHDDNLGADYGIVHLRTMYRLQLLANRIVPLGADSWPTKRRNFERFWLLGIPEETVAVQGEVWMDKTIRLLELDPLAQEQAPEHMRKAFPRQFYKIIDGMDDPNEPLDSIVGMSGGPVFAAREINDEMRYWLVGIQSGWDSTSRVVAVCPVDHRLFRVAQTTVKTLLSPNKECPDERVMLKAFV
jgi:hypothetical protein